VGWHMYCGYDGTGNGAAETQSLYTIIVFN